MLKLKEYFKHSNSEIEQFIKYLRVQGEKGFSLEEILKELGYEKSEEIQKLRERKNLCIECSENFCKQILKLQKSGDKNGY